MRKQVILFWEGIKQSMIASNATERKIPFLEKQHIPIS
jgi:hypothetical protein